MSEPFESVFEGTDTHDPLCGQYCPGPGVGKCRGGDCTLCAEVDCQCDLIAAVRADERKAAARRVTRLGAGSLYVDDDGSRFLSERDVLAAIRQEGTQ